MDKLDNTERLDRVHFGGVSFEDYPDTGSWISTSATIDNVGLIVDPHTVCEYLYSTTKGNSDFLKVFGKDQRLNFANIGQAHVISSFQYAVPKVLHSREDKVIQDDQSYLEQIPSKQEWEHALTGKRYCF